MLVVVADDDRTSRTLLAAMLRKWGHQVELAECGRTALELIARVSPHVAIIDWMMPELDGPEICRRVRRDPTHALTYLILLTARTSQADVLTGLDSGADDYVTKPFVPDELRSRLAVARRIIESGAESERLLASISSILIGVDAQGRITRWNSSAHETFGIAPRDAIGLPLSACGVPWVDPRTVDAMLTHGGTAPSGHELRFRDPQGAERLLGLTITTMKQGVEGTPGRVVIGAEVTARRLLEAQLRQAQKLEGIGQLAAGIAHEINTPMQYIGDNVRYLGDSIAALDGLFATLLALRDRAASLSPQELRDALSEIAAHVDGADLEYLRGDLPKAVAQSLEGVNHVSRIVRAMKEFSHPGAGYKELTDLNHSIETTLVVARNELKYVADVVLALARDLPPVPCLAGEINQVLLNLFINAAHAIADALGPMPASRGRISVSTHVLPAAVEIRVADTGRGIPEAIRSRIFEPFFTTKDVGKGTGQGLAMAHATVAGRHGGQIWFESEVGKGTTFYVRLPLDSAQEERAA